MTFRELMEKFEHRPRITRSAGAKGWSCTLTAIVPYETVTGVTGCRILGAQGGIAIFEFAVEGGTARLLGTIQHEPDGTQSLKGVFAVLSETAATAG